ncbi:MAG TPA: queuosine salvage family protein [Candidatus Acidoferrales bacterium]|nr:queuosine salvage family protein [Candidatus Acidoferrales bacterium]
MVGQAGDVRLGPLDRALAALAEQPVPAWDRRRHFAAGRAETIAYVLALDTLNFCFWGGRGGYWRLAEGLRDAFQAGVTDPGRLAAELDRWVGDLPLLPERQAALRELAEAGDPERLVQPTATGTARALAGELASFRDVADYAGREVPLLKRAQLAAADLAGAGAAAFPDLADLTCFADYKLPQALRHLGVLDYSERLARRVDDWRELRPGEPAEVEIRAATVVAVERLRDVLEAAGRRLRAFEVDWLLWTYSQGLYPVRPHHRVRTIYY